MSMDRLTQGPEVITVDRHWIRRSIPSAGNGDHRRKTSGTQRVEPIRIALGVMPRLLRDIVVDVIQGEPDMLVVGEADGPNAIMALVRETSARVVILGDRAADAGRLVEQILHEREDLRVLVLSNHGKIARMQWLEPRTTDCVDPTAQHLRELIRSAAPVGDRS